MIRIILVVYLATFIFEGPIRFVLGSLGGGAFLYLRDLALLQVIYLAFVLQPASELRDKRPVFIILQVLVLHAIVGFFVLKNMLQVFFGFKVFLPMLIGALAYKDFAKDPKRYVAPFAVFFFLAVVGVVAERFVHYPWTGYLYDVGDMQLGNSARSMMGVARVAGFARVSYEAAVQLLWLSVMLICFLQQRFVVFCIWLFAGVGIVATTTKGVAAAFVVCTGILATRPILPVPSRWYSRALIPVAAVTTTLPFLGDASLIELSPTDATHNLLFGSMWFRLAEVWPTALRLVSEHGDPLLGRGLGGIGAAQMFEYGMSSPGDNIAVYLYVTFGVLGFLYLAFVLLRAQRLNISSTPLDKFFLLILFMTMTFGLTANVIESATTSIWIGMAVAHLMSMERPKDTVPAPIERNLVRSSSRTTATTSGRG